ncbi:MAG: hypothetical protein SF182_09730, partial [Deltaproteobacteria bacterium]|nr:hypothetical protein [Deltaproteobacteria bacterium]
MTPPRLVFRWDLDKTYLLSEFERLRDMVKIPFEKPEDKIAAPGVAALIRGLRESALSRGRGVRVTFLSASPPQIGRAIRRKLELDGIVHDGIVFKNQLQRLFRGQFRHLREHVGYKLTELLKARSLEPPAAREYLFGDDWESDPLIYSLYADTVAGVVAPGELAELLRAARVDPVLIEEARQLAIGLPKSEAVARIFINLERPTPPAALRHYGERLVPTFNYFQTAACLVQEDALSRDGAVRVARSLVEESGYASSQLDNSLADIARRGHLRPVTLGELRRGLADAGLLTAPPPPLAARLRAAW